MRETIFEIICFFFKRIPFKIFLTKCVRQFIRRPAHYILLSLTTIIFISGAYIYLVLYPKWYPKLEPLIFLHQNNHIINVDNRDEIINEINLALLSMGGGSSIFKVSIGYRHFSNEEKSFVFDIARSCLHSNKKECVTINNKEIDYNYLIKRTIGKYDIENLEKDEIVLKQVNGNEIRIPNFKENSPICFKVFSNKRQFIGKSVLLRKVFPDMFDIFYEITSNVNEMCVSKIRHPSYHNVIFLLIFSFWTLDGVEPEKLNYSNVKRILKRIGSKVKQQLTMNYVHY